MVGCGVDWGAALSGETRYITLCIPHRLPLYFPQFLVTAMPFDPIREVGRIVDLVEQMRRKAIAAVSILMLFIYSSQATAAKNIYDVRAHL